MPRVCIVEPREHPAPGALERGLAAIDGFAARTVAAVPYGLDNAVALVLNSIPSAPDSIPEDRILRFIETGVIHRKRIFRQAFVVRPRLEFLVDPQRLTSRRIRKAIADGLRACRLLSKI